MGVIEKPYNSHAFRTALDWLAAAFRDGVPPPPPSGLRLSPTFVPNGMGLYALA